MAYRKKLTVDFYRVMMPDGDMTFEQLLTAVARRRPRDRNSNIRERSLRLQRLSPWGQCQEGELIRIRMDDLPPTVDLDGTMADMNLPPSTGVGECAAFAYHEETHVLAMQHNMHGASASAFAGYFDSFSGLRDCIVLEPVMREDEYRQLRRLTHPRKFEVRIAHASDPAIRERSTLDYARLAARHDAETMEITLTAGRSRDAWLNVDRVKEDASRFFGISWHDGDRTITKLKVSGLAAGDEVLAIDLLKGKLKHRQEVEIRDARTIPYETRRDVVRYAFEQEREALTRMFCVHA